MDQITIKNATSADHGNLIFMMKDFFAMFNYPFDELSRSEQVHEIISHPDWGRLITVKINTELAGYLLLSFTYSFEFGGRVGYVDELYLNSTFRGRGLGKLVLQQIKEEMKDMGLASLRLEVEQYNAMAIKLYQSAGFNVHESRRLMTLIP